jgi:hypothetical protein
MAERIVLDKIHLTDLIDLVPGLDVRPRELPDSVACVVARGPGPALLALVDETKPLAWQHLAQMLVETALVSSQAAMDLLLP